MTLSNVVRAKRFGLLVFLVIAGIIAMSGLSSTVFGEEAIPVLAMAVLYSCLLCLCLGMSTGNSERGISFCLWLVLLTSAEFFRRWNPSENTLEGKLAPEAYAEAGVWIIVFATALLLIARNPGLLEGFLRGAQKWPVLLAALCVISSAWSSNHGFSLAWAFKLCVGVLILQMCARHMNDGEGMLMFWRLTVWGFAFLSVAPIVRTLFSSEPMFEDGRFGNTMSPTALSLAAGTLFLLAICWRALSKNRIAAVLCVSGVFIMLFAGGKAAIFAGIVSAALYFTLQRKFGATLGVFTAIAVVAFVLVLFTPLSSYFHVYLDTGQAATLTGRTGLWNVAVPAALENPLLGHGYVDSRFVSIEVSGVAWDAGHMHNGFLEVMYNNGLPGLILMVLIHISIIRNLFQVLRSTTAGDDPYTLAAGCAAVYLNLFINGNFNAIFGGRANDPYLMLLGLVIVSERLSMIVRGVKARMLVSSEPPILAPA